MAKALNRCLLFPDHFFTPLTGRLGNRPWQRSIPEAGMSSPELFPDGRQEPLGRLQRVQVRCHPLLHSWLGENIDKCQKLLPEKKKFSFIWDLWGSMTNIHRSHDLSYFPAELFVISCKCFKMIFVFLARLKRTLCRCRHSGDENSVTWWSPIHRQRTRACGSEMSEFFSDSFFKNQYMLRL